MAGTISKQLRQAYEMQDFAFELVGKLRESLNGHALSREDAATFCALQKAWQGCQERISFHRRVPSPGSLKQPMAQSKRKRSKRTLPPPPTTPLSTPQENGASTS